MLFLVISYKLPLFLWGCEGIWVVSSLMGNYCGRTLRFEVMTDSTWTTEILWLRSQWQKWTHVFLLAFSSVTPISFNSSTLHVSTKSRDDVWSCDVLLLWTDYLYLQKQPFQCSSVLFFHRVSLQVYCTCLWFNAPDLKTSPPWKAHFEPARV